MCTVPDYQESEVIPNHTCCRLKFYAIRRVCNAGGCRNSGPFKERLTSLVEPNLKLSEKLPLRPIELLHFWLQGDQIKPDMWATFTLYKFNSVLLFKFPITFYPFAALSYLQDTAQWIIVGALALFAHIYCTE